MRINKLFAWDDNDCEITERDPYDLFMCNAEGGWESQGFIYSDTDSDGIAPNNYKHGDPVVEVRDCGRFIALETWAPDKEEADRRFRWHERYVQTLEDTE